MMSAAAASCRLASVALVVVLLPTLAPARRTSGLYIEGPHTTELLEKLSKKQLHYIKKEMLQILGLNKEPKLLKNSLKLAPQYMIDLYNEYSSADETDSEEMKLSPSNDIIVAYMNQRDLFVHREVNETPGLPLFFDLGEQTAGQQLRRATLKLYKRRARNEEASNNTRLTITIYNIHNTTANDDCRRHAHEFITSRVVDFDWSGWLDIDLTLTVSEWLRRPHSNSGLLIRVTNTAGGTVPARAARLVYGRHGNADKLPLLIGVFDVASVQQPGGRRRRATPSRPEKSTATPSYSTANLYEDYISIERHPCQRRTLFVDFEDLKWQEWIIAPKGYSAFYCYGECVFPLNSHMNATNHAIVQELFRNMIQDEKHVPKPCCAPTKLSPLSVLFFDEHNNVLLRDYQNMVVKACGCQ